MKQKKHVTAMNENRNHWVKRTANTLPHKLAPWAASLNLETNIPLSCIPTVCMASDNPRFHHDCCIVIRNTSLLRKKKKKKKKLEIYNKT